MSRYAPHGPAHLVLARLDEGGATRLQALAVAFPHLSNKKRRRKEDLLRALGRDGLIHRDRLRIFYLTRAGRDVLACLRSGQPAFINTTGYAEAA